ncbi:amino acid adenylation domain-containing protein [Streptomyces microflavus]|uniref:non-ribosomal peptide synthetase n=1 Tax=Streptomyces microflavus TaxID=1919 RepID=UPI0033DDB735
MTSYVSGGEVVSPPRWKTVFGALEEAAAQAPGTRIHLYDADGSYDFTTYGALHEDALRLSRWLTEYIGVRAGENLILQVTSSHEYLRVFWAAVHAGVVVVPLSVPNVVDRENLESVSRVLATLGSGRVVVGSRLADAYLPAIADAGVDRDAVLVLPRDAELPDTAGASAVPAAEPDGAAVIFFTSGSTGAPKGAVQTHEAILAREAGVTQIDGSGTDVQLNWMPLEHAAGILMSHLRGVCRLSEQVQVAPGHILADPLVWLDLIDKYRVNYTWAPQFAYSLLGNLVGTREDASWDLSCLRQSINAGEMLNARAIAQLTSQLAGFGLRPDVFVPVWGMAETCSGVFYNRDFVAADEAPGTPEGLGTPEGIQGAEGAGRTPKFVALGRPIPGLEVLVADDGGEAVPEGQVGHLLVRGACVTREYFHHPTANEDSFTPEGWFRTGDLAQVRDGVITMTGRAKQILIVNGLNFDLSEVEAAIEELPFVETSFTAAWAHTHPDSGEEQAVVFFVPRADGTDEPVTEVIRAHVLRRIGIRLHAVIAVGREDIPKTNLGKIQRAKLGAAYRDGLFTDRTAGQDGDERRRAQVADALRPLVGPGRYLTATAKELGHTRRAPGTGTTGGIALGGLGSGWARSDAIEAAVNTLPGVADSRVWTADVLLPGTPGAVLAIETRSGHPDYRAAVHERAVRAVKAHGIVHHEVGFVGAIASHPEAELLGALLAGASTPTVDLAPARPVGTYADTLVRSDAEAAPARERPGQVLAVLTDDEETLSGFLGTEDRRVVWVRPARPGGEVRLEGGGLPGVPLTAEVDPGSPEAYAQLGAALRRAGIESLEIAHLWALGPRAESEEETGDILGAQARGVFSVQNLLRELPAAGVAITYAAVFTRDALGVLPANPGYASAPLAGFVRSAVDEGHALTHIDLSGRYGDLGALFAYEAAQPLDGRSVVLVDGLRHKQAVEPLTLPATGTTGTTLDGQDGFLVVTGGLGGIGRILVALLLRRFRRNVLVLGRREAAAVRDRVAAFESIAREHGGAFTYAQSDLQDPALLRETIRHHAASSGQALHGVFHLAGMVHEALVAGQSTEELTEVFKPKVAGLHHLGGLLTQEHRDAFLVTFASARSLAPGATVSAYVAASDFAGHYSAHLRSQGIRATSVAWGVWDETGMSENLRVNRALHRRGIETIEPLQGLGALLDALRTDRPAVHIGVDGSRLPHGQAVGDQGGEPEPTCVVTDFGDFERLFVPRADAVEDAVRTHLGGPRLRYEILDELPVDRNGLVDRDMVLDRLDVLRGAVTVEPPRNATEERIRDICRAVFRVGTIGVTENLFDLGADSIATIQLLARLRDDGVAVVSHEEFYKEPTVRHLAEQAAAGSAADVPAAVVRRAADATAEVPLTPQQRRLWFLFQADPSSPYYNNTVSIEVSGGVVRPLLKTALMTLIDRHEALRVRFRQDASGSFWQHAVPIRDVDLSFDEHDLRELPESERARRLDGIIAASAATPFDLLSQLPLRAAVVTSADDRVTLVLTIHHIVSDGWSMGVILSDLAAIHDDLLHHGAAKLAPVDGLYGSYVADVTAYENSAGYRKQLGYWTDQLKQVAVPAELPARANSAEALTSDGEHHESTVGPEVLRGLRRLARDHDVSLYVLLLAAYSVLHQRLTLSSHVRLGTLIANRGRGNTSGLVGFLANTLPLDIQIDDAEPFSALVQQVKRKVIGLHDNQDVQFDSLVQALQPERVHNKNPLFQVLFVLQNAQIERLTTPEADWRLKIWESDTAKFDLSIQAFERDGDLDLVFEYRRDLFPRQDVERWVEAYHTVLRDLPGLLDPQVGRIDIVSQAERERILSINGPLDAALPPSIPAVLSDVVRERPDRPGLVMGAESYTFAELWDRSAAYAAYLRAGGVVPGSRVAITARRSPHVVIAMIAVARLGAAYVPVRPSDPDERRRLVLSDSGALVLLDDRVSEPLGGVRQLPLAVYDAPAADTEPAWHEADAAATPAYIMYTSGSTGRPKGVAVSAENVLRLAYRPDFVELGPQDVVLQTGSLTFDASTLEVWGALLNGAALHLVDEHVLLDITALREAIDGSGATVMWMSAPLFSQITDSDPGVFGRLRQLIVGGDVLPPRQIRAVIEACPGIRIINGYGPTENTTFSTTYRIPDDVPADRAIPIGRPVGHSSAYVLGGSGRLQPVGVPGELHVGGRGVALGYVNRDDLTAASFIDDPFAGGGRMYRTGDLVRLDDGLDIEFIGRVDHQVKVRGYRVELSEIELVIRSLDHVRDVAIEARTPEGGTLRLIAFYTADGDTDVRAELERLLPDYMVPAVFVRLDRLPLDRNGKVDRRRLSGIEVAANETSGTADGDGAAGEDLGPQANELRRIWAELLGFDTFGADDNFFSLGGDSIQVIQMTNRLRSAGYRVSAKEVFENQSVRRLAALMVPRSSPSSPDAPDSSVNTVERAGTADLAPVHAWFFDTLGDDDWHDHWNLPLVLDLDEDYPLSRIEGALRVVQQQHPALRARFWREGASWHYQEGLPAHDIPVREWTTERVADIQPQLTAMQRALSVGEGRMLLAGKVNAGTEVKLVLALHHLISDGVSLRILARDIRTALREAPAELRLPPVAATFSSWIAATHLRVASPEVQGQIPYWTEVASRIRSPFPRTALTESGTVDREFGVSAEVTGRLARIGASVAGAELQHALLATLTRAYCDAFGETGFPVLLEGHGRSDSPGSPDISGTVGWFTSMYPTVLRGAADGGPVADVQAVRGQLRAIPNGGNDYGALSYLDHSVPPLASAVPVAFNYLGAMPSGMELASSAYGDFRSGASRRECAIEFNIFKYGDDLKVSMRVDRAFADLPAVLKLQAEYERNLIALAEGLDGITAEAHAESVPEPAALPATDREAVRAVHGDGVQHVLPLTPAQEGLLYHQLMHPDGSDYFGQVVTTLYGTLDLAAFEAAWNIVIAENEMLRTVYGWESLSRPVQIVLGSVDFRIDHRDLTDRADEAGRREAVDDLLAADIAAGFDLTGGPLLRVTVVRTAADEHVFAFSFPHISLDGWSVFRILARTLELYDTGVPEPGAIEPAPSFRSYAEWLRNLDLTETRDYWTRYLAGSTPWTLPPEALSAADEDRFSQLDLVLDEEDTTLVREFAARAHCTLSTVLQTALALTLRIVSGADDMFFGVTVSGRSPDVPDVERVVGLLINTLPMRVRMAADEPVDALMGRIQTDGFGAIEHSGLATTHILENAGTGRSRAQFDVLFILENYPLGPEFLTSKNLRIGSFASHERTNYKLTVVAIPGDRLTVRFSSMTGVVEPTWVSAFMGLFRTALHQVASGHRLVADVDGVDATELADLLLSSQNAPTVEAEHEDQQKFFEDFRGPVFVLDENARPCPVGVPGHIHVAADSVSDLPVDGEWGQWMAEGEIEPGFPSAHRHLYPTGDVGMWTSRDSIKLLD